MHGVTKPDPSTITKCSAATDSWVPDECPRGDRLDIREAAATAGKVSARARGKTGLLSETEAVLTVYILGVIYQAPVVTKTEVTTVFTFPE